MSTRTRKSANVLTGDAAQLVADQQANDPNVKRLMAGLVSMISDREGWNSKVRKARLTQKTTFMERINALTTNMKVVMRNSVTKPDSVSNKVLASLEDITALFCDQNRFKEFGNIIASSHGDDTQAMESKAYLSAFLTTVVYNYVTATSRWMDFFRPVTLANDEQPELTFDPMTQQMLRVRSIGIDGGLELVRPQKTGGITRIFPDIIRIVTDDYEYPIIDPNRGDVRQEFINLVDHAMAIADAINDYLAALIQVSSMPSSPFTATFDITNANTSLRHYLMDSRVNSGNLPTGNYIVLPGNTSTSSIRQEFLNAIIKYAGRWGQFSDGSQLQLEAVHIASGHAYDWLDQIQAFGTQTITPVSGQVFANGNVMDYAGQQFNWVSDNTIDPAQGIAYVRFNRPVGEVYRKPGLDEVFHDTSVELRKKNVERMAMASHFGVGMPLQWQPFVLAIKYRS
jgi:hypothetical protein